MHHKWLSLRANIQEIISHCAGPWSAIDDLRLGLNGQETYRAICQLLIQLLRPWQTKARLGEWIPPRNTDVRPHKRMEIFHCWERVLQQPQDKPVWEGARRGNRIMIPTKVDGSSSAENRMGDYGEGTWLLEISVRMQERWSEAIGTPVASQPRCAFS